MRVKKDNDAASLITSRKPTQAEYPTAEYPVRVQVIRSKGQAPRYYVTIPLPLAAALDLQGSEEVQWQILNRTDLRLKRLSPKPFTK
jgi:hypothetical protein